MSLPGVLGIGLKTIPSSPSYLQADSVLSASWKQRLGPTGFKIGVCWQGNPQGSIDQGRSFALQSLAGVAALPGARLISLQMTHGLDQIAALPAGLKVETLGDDFDTGPDAFLDSAAVMANLDLVITCDTSIAHLAGALGVPVWVALKHVPDWRWMLERTDNPWYPSMKLYRQTARGDWAGVFARIARDVDELTRQARD